MSKITNTCGKCAADLSLPESVTRRYINKDDGDRYDCLDDSDTCTGCEDPL